MEVVTFALMLFTSRVVINFTERLEAARVAIARVEVLTLTAAAETYYVKHGDWPKSLKALSEKQPDGGEPFIPARRLLDPWKQAYQYDLKGPKNDGNRPDVWTKTKKGVVIGNWPEKKK